MFSSLAAAALHADLASRHYRMSAAPGGAPDVVTGRMPHRFATSTPLPSPDARAPVRLATPPTHEDDRFGARPGQDLSQIECHGVLVLDYAVQMPNDAALGTASST